MKNLYIVAFLFIGISSISFGQKDGILTGRIVDKLSDKPMEYVSFRLFSVKDSSVVAGIFTDPDGRFNLEQLAYGNFYGKLTFSGYETISINDIKISASIKSVNLGTYKMIIDKTIDFEEVKVIGQLDVLKAGIDKKIYNVG